MQRPSLAGVVFAHVVALVALVALGGCYQPELRDCTVSCTQPTDCTGGQVCRDDGWCAAPGITGCPDGEGGGNPGAPPDATPSPSDASLLCQLGCTDGSCVAGVCVIDCSAPQACQQDVVCPANVPCRVVCGDGACNGKISCGQATSCHVQCTGQDACDDEISCSPGRCRVECSGIGSCKHRTKCKSSCACDVSCTGAGSCAEPADCPGPPCKLGNGCSSALPGCDRC